MKKIISAIIIITNLFTTAANAAWEFEEKVITGWSNTLFENDGEIISYMHEYSYDPGDYEHDIYRNIRGYKYENGELITYFKTKEEIKDIRRTTQKLKYSFTFEKVNEVYTSIDGEIYNVSDKKFGVRAVNNGNWCIDAEGKNIFGGRYGEIIPLDYGKFLVLGDNEIKLLTRNDTALHTDIKTLINGVEIPCYSAEGRCVVVAEDLRNYGFDVIWNGEERRVDITRNPDYYNINPLPVQKKETPGSYYDKITTSDISVYFNGREINGYCINGVTLIQPESLKSEDISFNYDNLVRTLFMDVDSLERR